MSYYIHIPDPGFQDGPFPGERRLGPFNTEEEARAQAVSDVAAGMGAISGIFSEEESEKRRTPPVGEEGTGGDPSVTSEDVEAAAAEARRRIDAGAVAGQQEQEEMLRATLPEGVEWADLQQLAAEMRETAATRRAEDAG